MALTKSSGTDTTAPDSSSDLNDSLDSISDPNASNDLSDLGTSSVDPLSALSGIGSALGAAFGGGPTSSSSSSSTSTSTPFYAPSNFEVGGGSASSSGDIGSTDQNPSSTASATAQQGLPASATASSVNTSNVMLWLTVAGIAIASVIAIMSIKK